MEHLFAPFLDSLVSFARPEVFLVMLIGSLLGSIMGVIPGLSSGVACALALPFIFGMKPELALVLLASLTAVTHTSGAISAIVLGIPGVPSSAATVLDGFSMTQKGEGGRAIGAAIMASMLGGLASIAFAFIMIPVVVPIVLRFRAPELFLIVIVGLCFVVALVRGSRIKGFISAGLGLLMSYVGFQTMTGAARFTFHSQYLYSGIDLLIAMLGLFAIPVLIQAGTTGKTLAPTDTLSTGKFKDVMQGVRDVFHHWWLCLRGTVIGYMVGLIPGIGSEAAIWTSYGHAKQTSKHPEEFGKGSIEGVIAPEAADNSKEAGALLTTLAFGIPGSGIMAFFLAAFMIVGIVPGPRMLLEHTTVCFIMLLGIAFSNVVSGFLCIFGAPIIIKITRIPGAYLFAVLVPIVCIGAYSANVFLFDLITLVVIGFLGTCLKLYGYSLPAMIIGFVLGRLSEVYFWRSLVAHGPLFFLSPISISLIIIIFLILGQDFIRMALQKTRNNVRRSS